MLTVTESAIVRSLCSCELHPITNNYTCVIKSTDQAVIINRG